MAELVAEGGVLNACTAVRFAKGDHGELSLNDMVETLRELGTAVNSGDLASLERMLLGQVVALNAIFSELARRSALNMGEYIEATERYMRLALKAQGQCRATVETLAALKNPPVVFARQANINNGGQQQVNNGAALTTPRANPSPNNSGRAFDGLEVNRPEIAAQLPHSAVVDLESAAAVPRR